MLTKKGYSDAYRLISLLVRSATSRIINKSSEFSQKQFRARQKRKHVD